MSAKKNQQEVAFEVEAAALYNVNAVAASSLSNLYIIS
jgi:hypothetical protein